MKNSTSYPVFTNISYRPLSGIKKEKIKDRYSPTEDPI